MRSFHYPRKSLNPEFLPVLREVGYERVSSLAMLAGWPHHSSLSHLLYAPYVPDTPRTRERFAKLAALIGFTGPVLIDLPAPPTSSGATQEITR